MIRKPRGPRPVSRSGPRAPPPAPAQAGLRPRPAGHARREHRGPGSRSSPRTRAGRPRARRPRAPLAGEEHQPGIIRRAELPADGQAQLITVEAAAAVQGAAGSGCSERPRHHSNRPYGCRCHPNISVWLHNEAVGGQSLGRLERLTPPPRQPQRQHPDRPRGGLFVLIGASPRT